LEKYRTVVACFGTRPEVVKLAPVISRLRAGGRIKVLTVTTAQHRQLLDQALESFGMTPDVDLALMEPDQMLTSLSGHAIATLGETFAELEPDAAIVQGDTSTAFCSAFAAFLSRIPVAHVEAGLRTYDPMRPFPEEINRRLVTAVARWNFCPTADAADNLRREGVDAETIEVTGNTAIDAMYAALAAPANGHPLPPRAATHRVLVTLHRRETQGEAQRRLCAMLARVAQRPDVEIVFPVHLSPAVRESVRSELADCPNVHLLEPVGYADFLALMRSSDVIVTDSGGIQEEAPSLNIPVLVMRDTTERLEGVRAGCSRLAGTDPAAVEAAIAQLLDDPAEHARMASATNPYGDGHAAERIARRLEHDLAGAGSAWPAGGVPVA
jgi:UDP-N-acetylglucosamine 2-epimerase (non-hydrolysing)